MQSGSSWSGESDDLLADSGFTRTQVGLEADFIPEQDETQAGDLARKGDEGGGAVQAEFADEDVVFAEPGALLGRHHRQAVERADAWNPRATLRMTRRQ
jgi:hypothetical protein